MHAPDRMSATPTQDAPRRNSQSFTNKVRQKGLSGFIYELFSVTRSTFEFVSIIAVLGVISWLVVPYPTLARWFGFMLAGYSTIANDSIQTLGTFIASNAKRKWWYLWLFIGFILIATIGYSWVVHGGDVSYQRLVEKGFEEAPQTFSFLQIFAPTILLILTKLRIPVSTSFLLLSVFTTESGAIYQVVQKSLYGYSIAFVIALFFWYPFSKATGKYFKTRPWKGWVGIQWCTSGLLWSAWLMQDASNIAIFLPRALCLVEFLLFTGLLFGGLGVLFYLKGDKMQQLVNQKVGITDIRAATLVSFVYMLILVYFKNVNHIPISTTWVFIGLLGGREIAISLAREPTARPKAFSKSLQLIRRDLLYALAGLLISISLAVLANPVMQKTIQTWLRCVWPG